VGAKYKERQVSSVCHTGAGNPGKLNLEFKTEQRPGLICKHFRLTIGCVCKGQTTETNVVVEFIWSLPAL
jgi:hypothetical protein